MIIYPKGYNVNRYLKIFLEGVKMQYIRIKQLREDKDLTQNYIAIKLNMSQPQYARYESGRRDFPIDILIKIANIYNTSIDYLVGQTNEFKPYPKIK